MLPDLILTSVSDVAVDGVWVEHGDAQGDVLGAALLGRAVAHPLAWRGRHRLAGPHFQHPALELHAQHSAQHQRDLLELRPLTGLCPALGREHTGDTDALVPCIHAAGVFLDALRLCPCRGHDGRRLNQSRHRTVSLPRPRLTTSPAHNAYNATPESAGTHEGSAALKGCPTCSAIPHVHYLHTLSHVLPAHPSPNLTGRPWRAPLPAGILEVPRTTAPVDMCAPRDSAGACTRSRPHRMIQGTLIAFLVA